MHFFQDILCQYTIYTPTCGYLRYQPFIISLLPFIFVLSCKPNTRVRFSVSWWFGNEKHFCFFDYSESRSATNPCRIQQTFIEEFSYMLFLFVLQFHAYIQEKYFSCRIRNITIGYIPRMLSKFIFYFIHEEGSVTGTLASITLR